MTEQGSPGMLTRIEVVELPYAAPYITPHNMMVEESGGAWKVMAGGARGWLQGRDPEGHPRGFPAMSEKAVQKIDRLKGNREAHQKTMDRVHRALEAENAPG